MNVTSSKEVMNNKNYKIIELAKVYCNDNEESLKTEQIFLDIYRKDNYFKVVNKANCYGDPKEEYFKKYYYKHRDYILNKQNKYHSNNKEEKKTISNSISN